MIELDVVNQQLATMAEAPVTSLNIKHPYIAAGLNKLALANQTIQTDRLWFNVIDVLVTPLADTWIIDQDLPCGTISVWAKDPSRPVTWRAGQLLAYYDEYTPIKVPTWVTVHFEEIFRDLPLSANLAVAAQAVLDFQRDFDADSTKTRLLEQDLARKLAKMNAEHIRTRKTNLLTRASTAYSKFRVRGQRAYVVN